MSVHVDVTVHCDVCSAWIGDHRTARAARDHARCYGWRRVHIADRLIDLCPDCERP
jgi:hypothetical protein